MCGWLPCLGLVVLEVVDVADKSVLVVDDDPTVREVVQHYLERDGFLVRVAGDGTVALEMMASWVPDLVLLDLQLPGLDGLEVCRRIRVMGTVPLIMLTARAHESERIAGLDLGADDYVVKPFSPRELLARVRSVLRRSQGEAAPTTNAPVRVGDLTIDPVTRLVEVSGRRVNLTVREFDLLLYVVGCPHRVFTRTELLKDVWWYAWVGDTSTLTVHMRRLREKVEADPSKPVRLRTVYGVGYQFVPVGKQRPVA